MCAVAVQRLEDYDMDMPKGKRSDSERCLESSRSSSTLVILVVNSSISSRRATTYVALIMLAPTTLEYLTLR